MHISVLYGKEWNWRNIKMEAQDNTILFSGINTGKRDLLRKQ
jgi:hypothetical protein